MPATVSCVLLSTTTVTVPLMPDEVTLAPAWNPVPVTGKLKLLFFLVENGELLFGLEMVGVDCGLTVRVKVCGTVPPMFASTTSSSISVNPPSLRA